MKHVLFVCARNRLRSPTAEAVFAGRPDIEVASAGIANDAETPLDAEMVEWADIIFVMEKSHRTRLSARFRSVLKNKRVISLDIPDTFAFMDPALVRILEARVPRHLR
ncbi:MAG TPA: low molecular weight protein tyrosine phosphatase family protein [Rhizomicrobium sp.]|jgi:predicted protein tyrosine phosphatase